MLVTGTDLAREPLSVSVQLNGNHAQKLATVAVDIIKGFTKASCLAFSLAILAERDPDSEEDWALIEPFTMLLDRAFLVPCHAPCLKLPKPPMSAAEVAFTTRWVLRCR